MKKVLHIILRRVRALVLGFELRYYYYLETIKFFKSKKENVERTTFENTKSYVENMRKRLIKYYFKWQNAEPINKQTIEKIVRQEFANFDINKFTPQQRLWYNQMLK